jgi:hypothetical protein
VITEKTPKSISSGLTPDQPRAYSAARPVTRASPTRSPGLRTDQDVVRSGVTPRVHRPTTPSAQRMQPQRVASESVARSQPREATAASRSTNQKVVERSRVSPAQAQANRFGSTRVVVPNSDEMSSTTLGQPQRGRLRRLRNFVSNILNR